MHALWARGRVLLGPDRPPCSVTPEPGGRRWLVAGVGTRLNPQMFEALELACTNGDPGGAPGVFVDLGGFTHVVGPHGPVPVAAIEDRGCPVAPELFTLDG